MQFLIDSYNRNGKLHHAYAFEGDVDAVLLELNHFFESQLKFISKANPDYSFERFSTFGINEARELSQKQTRKSLSNGRKIFIIATDTMTLEAQNALLKVFEEPTPDTHFFLILNSFDSLVPTLRSRIFFVSKIEADSKNLIKSGKQFISSSIKERMSQIEKIGEEKNKKLARELLNGVEVGLHEILKNDKSDEVIFSIEEVLRAKHYLEDRSPSVKILLEHIAHIVPVVS